MGVRVDKGVRCCYIFPHLKEVIPMTSEKYPPISPGTPVRTTEPNMSKRGDWTDEGWASKKWGVQGTVITHHDSHGLCYDVRHEDGTQGCYEPSELDVVPASI